VHNSCTTVYLQQNSGGTAISWATALPMSSPYDSFIISEHLEQETTQQCSRILVAHRH